MTPMSLTVISGREGKQGRIWIDLSNLLTWEMLKK
jgi:hypothetical protein